jgi:hypothetical protein
MVAEFEEAEERGRYLAVRTGAQQMVIYRAVNLCETCSGCGCGEQQDPIDLSPGGIMRLVAGSGINLGDVLGGVREGRRQAKAARNGG